MHATGQALFIARLIRTAGVLAALLPLALAAQPFPQKALRVIVPTQAGGLIDAMGRQLGQHLAEPLGQPIVVENRPGSGGTIGADAVRQAIPDGYTLLVVEPSIVITPILHAKAGAQAGRDLQVITIVAATPLVLTVGAAVPAKDMTELIALAKANPGKLNYSSAGVGTTPHMSGELLKAQAGLDIVHVPYKGGSVAIADLLAGQIQMTFLASTVVAQYLKDGRLRAIATTGTVRSRLLPDVPTAIESGFAKFEVSVWIAMFAPHATPREIVRQLNAAVQTVLEKADFRAALAKSDLVPMGLPVEASEQFIRREEAKWAEVVRTNNVRPD